MKKIEFFAAITMQSYILSKMSESKIDYMVREFKDYCNDKHNPHFLSFTRSNLPLTEVKGKKVPEVVCWVNFEKNHHDDAIVDYLFENAENGLLKHSAQSRFIAAILTKMEEDGRCSRQDLRKAVGNNISFAFLKPRNSASGKLIFVVYDKDELTVDTGRCERVLKS